MTHPLMLDLATASRHAIEDELLARANRLACLYCNAARHLDADELDQAEAVPDPGVYPRGLKLDGECSVDPRRHWPVLLIVHDGPPLFGVPLVDDNARTSPTSFTYQVDRDLVRQLEAAK